MPTGVYWCGTCREVSALKQQVAALKSANAVGDRSLKKEAVRRRDKNQLRSSNCDQAFVASLLSLSHVPLSPVSLLSLSLVYLLCLSGLTSLGAVAVLLVTWNSGRRAGRTRRAAKHSRARKRCVIVLHV
jgi:hypothetical protein